MDFLRHFMSGAPRHRYMGTYGGMVKSDGGSPLYTQQQLEAMSFTELLFFVSSKEQKGDNSDLIKKMKAKGQAWATDYLMQAKTMRKLQHWENKRNELKRGRDDDGQPPATKPPAKKQRELKRGRGDDVRPPEKKQRVSREDPRLEQAREGIKERDRRLAKQAQALQERQARITKLETTGQEQQKTHEAQLTGIRQKYEGEGVGHMEQIRHYEKLHTEIMADTERDKAAQEELQRQFSDLQEEQKTTVADFEQAKTQHEQHAAMHDQAAHKWGEEKTQWGEEKTHAHDQIQRLTAQNESLAGSNAQNTTAVETMRRQLHSSAAATALEMRQRDTEAQSRKEEVGRMNLEREAMKQAAQANLEEQKRREAQFNAQQTQSLQHIETQKTGRVAAEKLAAQFKQHLGTQETEYTNTRKADVREFEGRYAALEKKHQREMVGVEQVRIAGIAATQMAGEREKSFNTVLTRIKQAKLKGEQEAAQTIQALQAKNAQDTSQLTSSENTLKSSITRTSSLEEQLRVLAGEKGVSIKLRKSVATASKESERLRNKLDTVQAELDKAKETDQEQQRKLAEYNSKLAASDADIGQLNSQIGHEVSKERKRAGERAALESRVALLVQKITKLEADGHGLAKQHAGIMQGASQRFQSEQERHAKQVAELGEGHRLNLGSMKSRMEAATTAGQEASEKFTQLQASSEKKVMGLLERENLKLGEWKHAKGAYEGKIQEAERRWSARETAFEQKMGQVKGTVHEKNRQIEEQRVAAEMHKKERIAHHKALQNAEEQKEAYHQEQMKKHVPQDIEKEKQEYHAEQMGKLGVSFDKAKKKLENDYATKTTELQKKMDASVDEKVKMRLKEEMKGVAALKTQHLAEGTALLHTMEELSEMDDKTVKKAVDALLRGDFRSQKKLNELLRGLQTKHTKLEEKFEATEQRKFELESMVEKDRINIEGQPLAEEYRREVDKNPDYASTFMNRMMGTHAKYLGSETPLTLEGTLNSYSGVSPKQKATSQLHIFRAFRNWEGNLPMPQRVKKAFAEAVAPVVYPSGELRSKLQKKDVDEIYDRFLAPADKSFTESAQKALSIADISGKWNLKTIRDHLRTLDDGSHTKGTTRYRMRALAEDIGVNPRGKNGRWLKIPTLTNHLAKRFLKIPNDLVSFLSDLKTRVDVVVPDRDEEEKVSAESIAKISELESKLRKAEQDASPAAAARIAFLEEEITKEKRGIAGLKEARKKDRAKDRATIDEEYRGRERLVAGEVRKRLGVVNASYTQKYQNLEEELGQSKNELHKVKRFADFEYGKLQAESGQQIRDLQEKLNGLKAQGADLTELNKARAEIDELKQQRSVADRRLHDQETELTRKTAQLGSFERDLRHAPHGENLAQTKLINELRIDVDQRKHLLEQNKNTIRDLMNRAAAGLDADGRDLLKELIDSNAMIHKQGRRIALLQKNIKSHKGLEKTIDEVTEQRERARSQEKESMDLINAISIESERQIKLLEEQLAASQNPDEVKRLYDEKTKLEADLKEQTLRVRDLGEKQERDMRGLREEMKELPGLREEVRELREQVPGLRDEAHGLREEAAAGAAEFEHMRDTRIPMMEEMANQQDATIDQLRETVDDLQRAGGDPGHVRDMRRRIVELERELTRRDQVVADDGSEVGLGVDAAVHGRMEAIRAELLAAIAALAAAHRPGPGGGGPGGGGPGGGGRGPPGPAGPAGPAGAAGVPGYVSRIPTANDALKGIQMAKLLENKAQEHTKRAIRKRRKNPLGAARKKYMDARKEARAELTKEKANIVARIKKSIARLARGSRTESKKKKMLALKATWKLFTSKYPHWKKIKTLAQLRKLTETVKTHRLRLK